MNVSTSLQAAGDISAAVSAYATTWGSAHSFGSVEAALPVPMVCPIAPPGAQVHVDTIMGYVMWAVIVLIGLGVFTSLGAFVGGRVFSMPHASKAGVVGIVVILVAVIAYFVIPPIIDTMMGSGCV